MNFKGLSNKKKTKYETIVQLLYSSGNHLSRMMIYKK